MSQTKVIAILGGCVLAATAGLWFWMQGGGDDAVATPAQPTERVGSAPPPPPPVLADQGGRDKPVVKESDVPRGTPALPAEEETRPVRDHRFGGDEAPPDRPVMSGPPEGHRIASTLTVEIGQRVRAKVAECAAQIPAEARGDKPRAEGLIVIAIKDKQVTVTSATMQLRNVASGAVEAAKQCIEAGALTVTQATTEADVASYDINVTFAL